MFWTKEKPEEDGWYWVRNHGADPNPIIVQCLLGGLYIAGEKER